MSDSALNYFLSSGTHAERLAFTPDPAAPGAGPDPTYLWFETDTGDSFVWDYGGSSWEQLNTAGSVANAVTFNNTSTGDASGTTFDGSGAKTIARNTFGLGTGDSPQFTAVNIGDASDTTITRVSGGTIAVEGSNVLTAATGQPLDATLTALAAFNTNGIVCQTAADTFAARTITGSAGVGVTNGGGIAGAPAIALSMDGAKVRKASNLTGQNLTSATAITWDTESWDTGGYHDNVTNSDRLTPPNAGYYMCIGNLFLANTGTGNFVFVQIERYNSSDVIQEVIAGEMVEISATATYRINCAGEANFSSGDFLRMRLQVESDTSTDITTDSWLSIRRVG